MIRFSLALLLFCSPVFAETVVATRTIQAKTIIGVGDVTVHSSDIAGAMTDPNDIIGMEARVALFAGRPIRPGDVGPPAIVERNQLILLHYQSAGLIISTDGRALGRAGPGDRIRVMNLNSRATVTAIVAADGTAYVQR